MNRSVLFDARLILPWPTGIGQYNTSLLPEMIAQAPDIHFHVLRRPDTWPDYGIETWQAPNLTLHMSRLPHMSWRQQLAVPRFAKLVSADLIHYPHFDAPVLSERVPVVATVHDAKYLVRPDFITHLNVVKRMYMRLAFRATLKRASAVLFISRATAADMQRLFSMAAGQGKVVHLAADPRFRPATAEDVALVKRRYKIHRPFILTVGERRPHKNHVGLIDAYARSDSRTTHDLVIVGQAYSDYVEPENCIRSLGLEDAVHFVTTATFEDLVGLYTAADIFVLVSLYEGFGLPILEAMACGTPVIASSTTATGEIAGPHSLQVDPTDTNEIAAALDRLADDEALRRQLAGQAAGWAASFDWKRTAKETLEVYRRLMAIRGIEG